MSIAARNAILMRLEEALTIAPEAGCVTPPPPTPSPLHTAGDVPVQHGSPDWQKLKAELAAIRTELDLASSIQDAHDALRRIVRANAIKSAVRWDHPRLRALGLDDALADAGVALVDPQCAQLCQGLRDVDLGVTAADAVFLDTGAIALRAGVGRPRAISLVPRVHLAIVAAEDLLPGLSALPELIRSWIGPDGKAPSAIHLISGPSGTADIELVYVQGIHGPLVLHVLALAAGWDGE